MCPTCFTFHYRQTSESATKHVVSQDLWTKLAANLFQMNGRDSSLILKL